MSTNSKTLPTLLNEIFAVIDWYRDTETPSIYILTEKRALLSALFVTLSHHTGNLRKTLETNHYLYKSAYYRQRADLIKETSGVKAEAEAKAGSIVLLKAEKEAEGDYYKIHFIRDSIKEVLSSMAQGVSLLKSDRYESRTQT